MQPTRYGLRIEIDATFAHAVERTTEALKAQGFGVVTSIDVQKTLADKLQRTFRKYVILGACNPPLIDRALASELEIGLLLPCNVIVYELTPGRCAVAAIAPMAALAVVGNNAELESIGREADARLRDALAALEATIDSH